MRFGDATAGIRESARFAGRFFILDSRVAIRGDFEREVLIEKFKPCCFAVAVRVLEVWHPCGARVGFYKVQPQ